jgi:hypothetical protein
MKRVLTILAAASSLSLAVADKASAQSLGGFPIREPGASRPAGGGGNDSGAQGASRNEVVVSQDAGSRVTTVAQAMRMVKPGGTILVKGGTYNENIVVTKPVEIRGVPGDYGRNAVFHPAPNAPCVSIAPTSALASVSLNSLIFEFDAAVPSGSCVDVRGGTVSVSNSFIVPIDANIPARAAYGPINGQMRPEILDQLARPARDNGLYSRVEDAFGKCKDSRSKGNWCKATSPEAVSSCASMPAGGLSCQSSFAISGVLECEERGRDLWCRGNQILPAGGGNDAARLETYIAKHAQPVGAENAGWQAATGGTRVEEILHARTARGAGLLSGPSSGIRVTAGDVRLDGNVIVGARTAVSFGSDNNAFIKGALTNNVIIGNGVGIAASGGAADLLLTRNTIRYNAGDGVNADVYDGVKIIANEISGNQNGIFLSEKVRMATVSSNLVAKNFADAMRVSSGFFGAVNGNTFAENGGCTIQFFSAEQKILNNADIKVTAFRDFTPQVVYENTNYAVGNSGDASARKFKKSRRDRDERAPAVQFASCDAPL